jgi:hypothetical protein
MVHMSLSYTTSRVAPFYFREQLLKVSDGAVVMCACRILILMKLAFYRNMGSGEMSSGTLTFRVMHSPLFVPTMSEQGFFRDLLHRLSIH